MVSRNGWVLILLNLGIILWFILSLYSRLNPVSSLYILIVYTFFIICVDFFYLTFKSVRMKGFLKALLHALIAISVILMISGSVLLMYSNIVDIAIQLLYGSLITSALVGGVSIFYSRWNPISGILKETLEEKGDKTGKTIAIVAIILFIIAAILWILLRITIWN